ncbi:hypothetical protein [Thiomicrorhabdus sp.]|uniref:SLAC1 family transporter n=1 Tax=Thiomicrorhabdus sp. TaxID=2039724 RepID=UPI0029C97B59|nr:hypothetical protein [Thiomicrorhabdus sp.]
MIKRLQFSSSIVYFGMPMGLIGAGMNANHFSEYIQGAENLAVALWGIGVFSLLVISAWYALEFFQRESGSRLRAEWRDPFLRSFFPAVTLTTMLALMAASLTFQDSGVDSVLRIALWGLIGLHFSLNLVLISGWIFEREVLLSQHLPTWFILLSGNFIVVISSLYFFDDRYNDWLEFRWLFYSVGLFFWFSFSVSLLMRLIFFLPVPTLFRPSLFIFLAPASLACVASVLLEMQTSSDSLKIIIWVTYSFATLFLFLWILSFRFFYQSGITRAAWSYIYPLAAYGLASQYMADLLDCSFLWLWSSLLLFALLMLISILLLHPLTAKAASQN